MKILRIIRAAIWLICVASLASPVIAQDYPIQPITWIVPYPAGGGADFMSRTVAVQMSKTLGQPLMIENRGGAAGAVGMTAAARARANGYTLVTGENGSLTINPHLYRKLSYDSVKDFQPVGLFAKVPFFLLVDPAAVPVNNFQEFVAYAKANPGKMAYGSFGAGSIAHLMGELLKQRVGIHLLHIPYKGAAPAVQDFLGGQISMIFLDYGTAKQYVENGKMKALAVTTKDRYPGLPNVPSLDELGVKGYDAASWMGLLAPAKTPKAVIDKLSQSLNMALQSSEVTEAFSARGIIKWPGTADDYSRAIDEESVHWGAVIKQAGIKAE